MGRKNLPIKIQRLLQKEINSVCPVLNCNNIDVDHFQIHHIDEDKNNNIESNLIMLCPTCHSKVHKGDLTQEDIIKLKINLILNKNKEREDKTCNIFNIQGGNESIVTGYIKADNIVFKGKTRPKMNYPEGSIGADINKKNYIKHLIDRYNEYTKDDNYKPNFSFSIIYKTINKKFGASCYNITSNKFDELSLLLQEKIKGTRLGRILNSKGQKLYSTFEEYLIKYCK